MVPARTPYTIEDKDNLARILLDVAPASRQTPSTHKYVERKLGRHTYQSWMSHYKSNREDIERRVARLERQRRQHESGDATVTSDDDDSSTSTSGSSDVEPDPVASTAKKGKRVPFDDDVDWPALIQALAKQRTKKWTSRRLYEYLGTKYPNHTVQSWQTYHSKNREEADAALKAYLASPATSPGPAEVEAENARKNRRQTPPAPPASRPTASTSMTSNTKPDKGKGRADPSMPLVERSTAPTVSKLPRKTPTNSNSAQTSRKPEPTRVEQTSPELSARVQARTTSPRASLSTRSTVHPVASTSRQTLSTAEQANQAQNRPANRDPSPLQPHTIPVLSNLVPPQPHTIPDATVANPAQQQPPTIPRATIPGDGVPQQSTRDSDSGAAKRLLQDARAILAKASQVPLPTAVDDDEDLREEPAVEPGNTGDLGGTDAGDLVDADVGGADGGEDANEPVTEFEAEEADEEEEEEASDAPDLERSRQDKQDEEEDDLFLVSELTRNDWLDLSKRSSWTNLSILYPYRSPVEWEARYKANLSKYMAKVSTLTQQIEHDQEVPHSDTAGEQGAEMSKILEELTRCELLGLERNLVAWNNLHTLCSWSSPEEWKAKYARWKRSIWLQKIADKVAKHEEYLAIRSDRAKQKAAAASKPKRNKTRAKEVKEKQVKGQTVDTSVQRRRSSSPPGAEVSTSEKKARSRDADKRDEQPRTNGKLDIDQGQPLLAPEALISSSIASVREQSAAMNKLVFPPRSDLSVAPQQATTDTPAPNRSQQDVAPIANEFSRQGDQEEIEDNELEASQLVEQQVKAQEPPGQVKMNVEQVEVEIERVEMQVDEVASISRTTTNTTTSSDRAVLEQLESSVHTVSEALKQAVASEKEPLNPAQTLSHSKSRPYFPQNLDEDLDVDNSEDDNKKARHLAGLLALIEADDVEEEEDELDSFDSDNPFENFDPDEPIFAPLTEDQIKVMIAHRRALQHFVEIGAQETVAPEHASAKVDNDELKAEDEALENGISRKAEQILGQATHLATKPPTTATADAPGSAQALPKIDEAHLRKEEAGQKSFPGVNNQNRKKRSRSEDVHERPEEAVQDEEQEIRSPPLKKARIDTAQSDSRTPSMDPEDVRRWRNEVVATETEEELRTDNIQRLPSQPIAAPNSVPSPRKVAQSPVQSAAAKAPISTNPAQREKVRSHSIATSNKSTSPSNALIRSLNVMALELNVPYELLDGLYYCISAPDKLDSFKRIAKAYSTLTPAASSNPERYKLKRKRLEDIFQKSVWNFEEDKIVLEGTQQQKDEIEHKKGKNSVGFRLAFLNRKRIHSISELPVDKYEW
ncbi:uncharacterized protein JCM15063_000786 [Sporobolomyces koalae]|uniref:uncharacterized protein n=1 Tax=Sporobolomyces koalae TaxID=500713 RepID=UPI00317EF9DF